MNLVEFFEEAAADQPREHPHWQEEARAAADPALTVSGEANRALALAPDLVEGLVALGQVLASDDLDWKGADATFRKAIELAPGNAAGLHSASWLAAAYGRIDEALALARRIVALDPLAVDGHVQLARLLANSGAHTDSHFKRTGLSVEEPVGRIKRRFAAATVCSARLWWHFRAGGAPRWPRAGRLAGAGTSAPGVAHGRAAVVLATS